MQVHFLPSIPSIACKSGAVLLCAGLLTACNAKLTEPIRLQAVPNVIPLRIASDQKEPVVLNYGVPDTSQVVFEPSAQTQTEDLTY
jgi:hypothetical protein